MKQVILARSKLLLEVEFWGMLSMRLELRPDPSCETFWTDGKTMGFNPTYSASLTTPERMFVVGHEVFHCADGHIWRFPGIQKGFSLEDSLKIWNEACDYAINPPLIQSGLTMPKGGLVDPRFYGKSAEEIFYKLLAEYRRNKKKPKGGGFGEIRPTPNKNDAAAEQQEWKQAVLQAARMTQGRGRLPEAIERLIDDIRNPAIDWRAATRKFLEQNARADFTYRMPNKRYVAMGMYMPSLRSERLPPVVVMGDSSGSLDDQESRQKIASEVVPIVQEARPEITYWICGDEEFQCSAEYQPDDHVDLKFKGGGGTDFRWAFEWVKEQGIEPACFIGITDLMGTFPKEPPDYPVLWAATTDCEAPWGEILRIK